MKTCLVLTSVLLLAEGRGDNHRVHGVPATLAVSGHLEPAAHVAADIGHSHNATAGTYHQVAAGKGNIVPPLVDVASDKKFYGPPFPADYPDDVSPPAEKGLFKKNSVYPKVQEEGFFDTDYVKDENSDRGQWKAQSDYDAARTKAANEKRQAENAAKRAEKEAQEEAQAADKFAQRKQQEEAVASEAKKAADEADGAAQSAKNKAAEAHAEAEDQQRKAAEAADEAADAAGADHTTLEKRVKNAEETLAKETAGFKECQKQLQEAKAKVEELQRAKEKLEKEGETTSDRVAAETEEMEKGKKAVEEAKFHANEAEAKQVVAEKRLQEAHEKNEAAKQELEQQEAEKKEAQRVAAKEGEDLKEAEKELESTKSTLRHIRGLEAVPAGATEAPKEGAAAAIHLSACVAVAVVALIF